jgi:hypothetical protein
VAFAMASPTEGSVKLEGAIFSEAIKTASTPQSIKFPLRLESGEVRTFGFTSQLQRLSVPGDPRNLYFYVQDFVVTPLSPTHKCINQ